MITGSGGVRGGHAWLDRAGKNRLAMRNSQRMSELEDAEARYALRNPLSKHALDRWYKRLPEVW